MSVGELLETEQLAKAIPPSGTVAAFSLRQSEIQRRHQLLSDWLTQTGLDAVILSDPDNFSWFTAGARWHDSTFVDWGNPSLFVTKANRCLVGTTGHTSRLFQDELDGLGFQVKELPWTRPARELLQEMCNNRKVGCDVPFGDCVVQNRPLAQLRMHLSDYDIVRLRLLAARVSHAVEATCRQLQRGDSEWEIRAHLAHRLLHHDIECLAVNIFADDRADRTPDPRPSDKPVNSHCTIQVCARSRGLTTTTSRTVCFGSVPEAVFERHRIASMTCGALLRNSIAGVMACDVLQRGLRILEKHGYEFDWHDAPLGTHAAYVHRCFPITPKSQGHLRRNTALVWSPYVRGVVSAETVIVRPETPEVLCRCEDWPVMGVNIRDFTIDRPGILVR